MTDAHPDCRHARLHIGADPRQLPDEVRTHVAGCAACARLLDETRALDARLRQALELPLAEFRAPTRTRWGQSQWKIAASLLLGLLVGGGVWLATTPPALAGEVVEHIRHEGASWGMHQALPAGDIAKVLRAAGVEFDTTMPVVYASACPFRGRTVSHLVVQSPQGPLTVMLLAHEKVSHRTVFAEQGYSGVLLPSGEGSVAVLARGAAVPESVAGEIVSGARW
jgi:hypothetical protein